MCLRSSGRRTARRTALFAALACAVVGPAERARAQTLGSTFVAPGAALGRGYNYTLGYAFNVTAPVAVTSLAYYDDGRDGLAFSHDVGLWNASGQLLARATVPAGTAGALVDFFRLVQLGTPVTLDVGNGYVVGGFNPADGEVGTFYTVGRTSPAGITFVDSRYVIGTSLADPTDVGGSGGGYYGGDFGIGAVSAVPEPADVVLVAVGLAGTTIVARRRRVTDSRSAPPRSRAWC